MQKQNKKGFTLAELLITLAIMGVVMAITIPSLVTSTQKNAYINSLKKTYGLLDTATNQIMTNNSGTLIKAFATGPAIRGAYGNILEFSRTCNAGAIIGNCWPTTSSKLSGGATVEAHVINVADGAILPDGSFLVFEQTDSSAAAANCKGVGASIYMPYQTTDKYYCGITIFADINGFNGPNTIGRDQYIFLLASNGLTAGGDPHNQYYDMTTDCNPADMTHDGYGCASKVLNEGAMNY